MQEKEVSKMFKFHRIDEQGIALTYTTGVKSFKDNQNALDFVSDMIDNGYHLIWVKNM